MYHLESPPASATSSNSNSTLHPYGGGWNDLSPISPTEAEAHSHLGHGPFPHQQQYQGGSSGLGAGGTSLLGDVGGDGTGEEGAAALLRRHQSLQQGYGKSHRVADRLARSQAILAIENRTGTSAGQQQPQQQQERERERSNQGTSLDVPPTSPIGRSAWSNAAVGYDGNDGWDELNQLKQRQAQQGQSPGSGQPQGQGQGQTQARGQQRGGLDDMDPVRRLRLLQAMEAMQLGSEMIAPPGSTPGLMAAPAGLAGLATASTIESQLGDSIQATYDHSQGHSHTRSYGSAAIAQGAYGTPFGTVDGMNASVAAYDRQLGQVSHGNDFYQRQDYASASPQLQQGPMNAQPGFVQMGYGNQPGYSVLPSNSGYNASGPYYAQGGMPVTGVSPAANSLPNYYGLSAQSDPMQLQQMQRQAHVQQAHMLSPQNTGPGRPPSAGHAYPKSAPIAGSQNIGPAVHIPPEIAEAAAREVREMVEKRGLNPAVFDCEVAEVSIGFSWQAIFFTVRRY